jgi:hypothetical protein
VPAIDGAHDGSERDYFEAERALTLKSEGRDHLLVRQDHSDVIRLATEACDQLRGCGMPSNAQEVVLRVDVGHSG